MSLWDFQGARPDDYPSQGSSRSVSGLLNKPSWCAKHPEAVCGSRGDMVLVWDVFEKVLQTERLKYHIIFRNELLPNIALWRLQGGSLADPNLSHVALSLSPPCMSSLFVRTVVVAIIKYNFI